MIFIGIDLGATYVRAGALNRAGDLLAVQETQLEARRGPEFGLKRIFAVVRALLADDRLHLAADQSRSTLSGIGVGATGPTDALRGMILNPGTLPGWVDVPIVARLEREFGVPACIENDADAAALGEYWKGAGVLAHQDSQERGTPELPPEAAALSKEALRMEQRVARLYAVTVGTGIGTACVIEGRLYRGAGGFHPEGGHQVLDPNGPSCYCGGRGCWEALASGTAIARLAGEALAQPLHRSTQLNFDHLDARRVAEAASQGDPLAGEIMERAADYFAAGLLNIVQLFFPDLIVLSGGVMRSLDLFWPAIQRMLIAAEAGGQPGGVPTSQLRILPARLGYYAGIYGAAYALLQRLEGVS